MTRITLDLDKLVAAGRLDTAEAQRLRLLGAPSNRFGVLINLLLILGALGVAGGVIALEPTPAVGLFLAVAAAGGGGALYYRGGESWKVLAHGLVIMGCVGLAGWIGWQAEDGWPGARQWIVHFLSLLIFSAGAILFRQAFLAALAPLALGAMVGSGTAYWHASYGLFVQEPAISAILFGAVAGTLYAAREWIPEAWKTVTTVAARTSFFMINFAFWVGSLWGDYVGEHWATSDGWSAGQDWRNHAVHIHEALFSIGWLALLSGCIWTGTRDHRRFLANTSITFLAIHAYTQFFETFGMYPWTLVIAGLALVGVAVGIARFDAWNRSRSPGRPRAA